MNPKDAMKLAKEWAHEMQAIGGPQFIIAEEFAWGFREVENGRHPKIVLKDVVERINARKKQREGQNETNNHKD
jgi:hypothetical protein